MSETTVPKLLEGASFTDSGNLSVIMYPSYGALDSGQRRWRIYLQGAVLENGQPRLRIRMMLRMLQRVMDVQPDDLENQIFRQRMGPFLTQSERRRRISIRWGQTTFHLEKKSKRSGYFTTTLQLPMTEAPSGAASFMVGLDEPGLDGPLVDGRRVEARIHLVPQQGWSVISDIDDTIKHTNVLDRRELLANTFLREFRSISGMADVYRRWGEAGAVFHYVSFSPWPLYAPLQELLDREGFPQGTFHLSNFRLRDQMLKRVPLLRRRARKCRSIAALLRRFPQRRFILVGDSAERDPEIYAAAARRFPSQIAAICIRQLDPRPLSGDRWEKTVGRTRRLTPAPQWRIFRQPSELEDVLDCAGRTG